MDIKELLKAITEDGMQGLAKSVQKEKGVNLPEINFDVPEDERKKNLMVLKEIANTLTDQSNHYAASSVLEIVSDNDTSPSLRTKLAMGESYLSLGREAKAFRYIDSVRNFLLSNPSPPADEVFQMVESMVEANMHLRALILLPVATKLYMSSSEPNNAVEGVFRCIKKADECTCPMIDEGGRSRVLGIDFGLAFMESCLEDMLKIQNVEDQKLSFKHCHVAMWIAFIYWKLRDNFKGIKVRRRAVRHMENAMGMSAKQYRVYASTYYNIGVGYAILNKNHDAKQAYETAIDALESATDFDDKASLQTEMQQYRQKLRELRNQ